VILTIPFYVVPRTRKAETLALPLISSLDLRVRRLEREADHSLLYSAEDNKSGAAHALSLMSSLRDASLGNPMDRCVPTEHILYISFKCLLVVSLSPAVKKFEG
jgi:hypothetical protein